MSERNIHNPVYRIETERLIVRCYNPSDAQMLADSVAENVEHLKPWMPWAHAEPEQFEVKVDRLKRYRGEFDLGEDFIYGIFDKAETGLLGGTGLHTRIRVVNPIHHRIQTLLMWCRSTSTLQAV